MLAKIRGLFATLCIIVYLPIIILQIYFTRHKQNGRKARLQCGWFFTLNGFHVERIGEFDTSAQLIILNHQSVSDIMFLEGFHPSNICWVAKKQLGEIPLYGYALTLPEMILIDREDKAGIVFLLKSAKEKLAQNRPIVIFPEGTRGKGEEELLPFKPGAKVLAEKLKLKIQPILIINSRKMYDTAPVASNTNKARIVMLQAFIPDFSNPNWYAELESLMTQTYQAHYAQCNP
ncbi:MAG: 1-acylglycerol-3-phosphate O-acyltransferase [Helicobacter sp.]|uniref:1-acylglycerol-3-phosphate O-acyltransferase n=1 Tax=Helicobacter sp. 10-6591 TaxID=2004998 RepID=UPI000DCC22BB|nr:1-acylglycerol-3-phosphate O-acyltransferase [Helicobacter sp. 10-6591]MCI6217721.1 1-acylglycerol-3-phosphate O-acyltransferase [Helicobacter sp.]MCI7484769.1 1-acylglycerol-3-phosphate O-acyltransferase [Helicobacter sp.]MDD7566798.1 1-acylglycerol-3-phosphate O-acyltransferase [Helicobacter sp.]MDY5741137.1 1-acylglycerol-3-phosphate O-acyltransferase [Helicobacter sp.]RAX56261.1 1-acyl-sn-glycerol-3-phosphate acyltransferase [Helicobacter sp. 10-6591]